MLRVGTDKKPSHVGKEEASLDVVGVGVCVHPFVMTTVPSTPSNHVLLEELLQLKYYLFEQLIVKENSFLGVKAAGSVYAF